jgi:hypothetical protein
VNPFIAPLPREQDAMGENIRNMLLTLKELEVARGCVVKLHGDLKSKIKDADDEKTSRTKAEDERDEALAKKKSADEKSKDLTAKLNAATFGDTNVEDRWIWYLVAALTSPDVKHWRAAYGVKGDEASHPFCGLKNSEFIRIITQATKSLLNDTKSNPLTAEQIDAVEGIISNLRSNEFMGGLNKQKTDYDSAQAAARKALLELEPLLKIAKGFLKGKAP